MRSRTVTTLVLLGVLAAAVGLVQRFLRNPESSYITVAVNRAPIEETVTALGTVNPVNTVEVGTYVSGRLERLDVDFNSRVTKGQVIAKIDPANYRVKVQQARAKMAIARARVQRAEAEEAGLVQAEAELEDARVSLSYTDIVSPVDGIVLSRNVSVGQTVAASFQTPTLFLIAHDLTEMQVNASVSESDIGRVREGQEARFEVDAYPGRLFLANVIQVRNAPISVQNVVTYDVVINVANPELALKPGMTARVTLTTDRRDDALRVPLRALRFRPDDSPTRPVGGSPRQRKRESAVWMENGVGGPRRVEVQTGIRDEEAIEIVSGSIQVGDRVIIGYVRER